MEIGGKTSVEHGWIVQSKQARARLSAEKIIDVARERFISKGYAKTSISEIAVTAGASVGSIYQRFPEKISFASDYLAFALSASLRAR
jgi:AcrR family transcriptional regulator